MKRSTSLVALPTAAGRTMAPLRDGWKRDGFSSSINTYPQTWTVSRNPEENHKPLPAMFVPVALESNTWSLRQGSLKKVTHAVHTTEWLPFPEHMLSSSRLQGHLRHKGGPSHSNRKEGLGAEAGCSHTPEVLMKLAMATHKARSIVS